MPDNIYTAGELEVGRRMFAADWQFTSAASSLESLPPMQGIEIAFAGRSNVGKSSLINALTNKNDLARTSHTPGRTQELIFFHGGSSLNLVDMPGYGFAKAPKEIVLSWNKLIQDFLRGRANLARVYVLVDSGYRCVIAPSFGDIFSSNAIKNGLLPAIVSETDADALLANASIVAGGALRVDLAEQTIVAGNLVVPFTVRTDWKQRLLNGWDDVDLTKSFARDIAAFVAADATLRPWARPLAPDGEN